MKLRVSIAILAAALMSAGAASAQSYGGFGAKKTTPSFSRAPSPSSSVPSFPAPPKPPSPPPAPTFKPYEPYKASSVYSAPKPATGGAKDCELSVYVNACGKRAR